MVRCSPEERSPGRGGDRYADSDVSHSVPEPKPGLAKQRRDRDVVRLSALRARIADLDIEDVRASDVYAMMAAFLPYAKVQRDALSQGEVPLWNRFNGTGRALWGQGQTFFGDPLHWLTFLDADWGQDLKFVAHRFVFAAGVGLVAFTAGCSWLTAAMAAALTPFLGFYTFRFNHDAAFALSYAPWILMAWLWLAGARTRFHMARAAVLLSVASALVLLASPPKEATVMLAGCQAAGLLVLLLSRKDAPGLWPRLGFATVAGAAMVAITAPHWVAFLDTLRNSLTLYDRPAAALFPFAAAPQILLGSLNPVLVLPVLQIAAVPLLIAAVVSPRQLLQRPAILACLVIAMCLIAVAFGAVPADWLVRVPLVANIHQVNNTTTTAAIVLLSVVCAVGAESLLAASLWKAGLLTSLVGLTAVWLFRDAAVRAVDMPRSLGNRPAPGRRRRRSLFYAGRRTGLRTGSSSTERACPGGASAASGRTADRDRRPRARPAAVTTEASRRLGRDLTSRRGHPPGDERARTHGRHRHRAEGRFAGSLWAGGARAGPMPC